MAKKSYRGRSGPSRDRAEIEAIGADVFGELFNELGSGRPREIDLGSITVDPVIQVRAGGVDLKMVATYADRFRMGGDFPPIVVFQDEDTHWLSDGFHRYHAAVDASMGAILAEVRQGTRQDALDYSLTANLAHGFYINNTDKQHILWTMLLIGHEWAQWSARKLGEQFSVNDKTIGQWIGVYNGYVERGEVDNPRLEKSFLDWLDKYRAEATAEFSAVDRSKTLGADGKVRDTTDIGAVNGDPPTPVQMKLFPEEVEKEFTNSVNFVVNLPKQIDQDTRGRALEKIKYLRGILTSLEESLNS